MALNIMLKELKASFHKMRTVCSHCQKPETLAATQHPFGEHTFLGVGHLNVQSGSAEAFQIIDAPFNTN